MTDPSRRDSRLHRALRDPVVRFLIVGALIFAVHRAMGGTENEPIVVSSRLVEGLEEQHRQRFGREPSPSEAQRLVDEFVREEAMVREATNLALDRGDPIVRRRLVQKMEMILRGNLDIERPDDAACRAWIAEHPQEVALDERISLRHAFASRDRRGNTARDDAAGFLAGITTAEDPAAALAGLGDAFALGPSIERRTLTDLGRQLGDGFRDSLRECAIGRPCGPIESTFGFHAVVVTRKEPAGALSFAQARPIAERAILRDREDAALGRAIEEVVARHGVRRVEDRSAR